MHRDGRQLVKGGSSQLSAKQLQQRIGTKPCLTDCLDGLMILHEMHRSEYDHLYLFICISWESKTQDWISSWAFCMWMKYIYVYFYVCWIILEESYYFEFNGNFNFLLGTSLNHLLYQHFQFLSWNPGTLNSISLITMESFFKKNHVFFSFYNVRSFI